VLVARRFRVFKPRLLLKLDRCFSGALRRRFCFPQPPLDYNGLLERQRDLAVGVDVDNDMTTLRQSPEQ
jgi:hypothetical protein